MKKNIVIIVLSIIIVILIYHVMNPAVVTERRASLKNQYSDTTTFQTLDINDNVTEDKEIQSGNDYDNYETESTDNDFKEEYTQERPKNDVIRFPKEMFRKDQPPRKESPPKVQKQEEPQIVKEDIKQEKSSSNRIKKDENSYLSKFIKTCKPYKETLNAKYMDIDMNYEIEIAGWINNKCVINFTSKANGISSDFGKEYGLTPDDIINIDVFAPKIRCEFTKTQLLLAGDSILQENERNAGKKNNMLKDPNNISFPEFTDLSLSDYKLLQILFSPNTCKILNLEDLKKLFTDILNF